MSKNLLKKENPYGDGFVSKRIADILLNYCYSVQEVTYEILWYRY